jgi:hypothetical protein
VQYTPDEWTDLAVYMRPRIPTGVLPSGPSVSPPITRVERPMFYDGCWTRSTTPSATMPGGEGTQSPSETLRSTVEAALQTASAIGDDRLQRESQGYVVPDAFTHGSSAQRTRWFMTGLKSGTVSSCDAFRSEQL